MTSLKRGKPLGTHQKCKKCEIKWKTVRFFKNKTYQSWTDYLTKRNITHTWVRHNKWEYWEKRHGARCVRWLKEGVRYAKTKEHIGRVGGCLREIELRDKFMSIDSTVRIYKTVVLPLMTYAMNGYKENNNWVTSKIGYQMNNRKYWKDHVKKMGDKTCSIN